jgi:GT2 family glycosyltransferase
MRSPNVPLASVVVPAGGARASLGVLLEALSRQTVPRDRFEVVVVVNPPDDETVRLVERFDSTLQVVALSKPRRGRAAACNAGVALAGGELVVFLDDDMCPAEEWLERHLERHAASSGIVALGAVPVRLDAASRPLERWVADRFASHHKRLAEPRQVFHLRDFFSGNASLRREVFTAVGGFDEEYAEYGHEDLELCLRLRGAGVGPVFEPRAIAHQRYCKGFGDFSRDMRAAGGTAVLLARKHPEAASAVVEWRNGPPAWEWLKRRLLAGRRRRRAVPAIIRALGAVLERVLPSRTTLFYSLAADYFFWLGVRERDPTGNSGILFGRGGEKEAAPLADPALE